ncbi:MAG: DUF2330 domain-containing protein [Microbacteriaceae bacterium]
MRRIWAVALLTLALLGMQVAVPASACACGGLATPFETEASVSGERAIVSLRDGVQTIDLMLDLLSTSDESGLIIPTPNPAEVSQGDRSLFSRLESTIAPKPVYVEDWWGLDSLNVRPTGGVSVLKVVTLGPVEATTLAASDARGLDTWLRENGFTVSTEMRKQFPFYVKAGWSFVALKLTGTDVLAGALDPVRLTFETDEFVYPMRFSRAATEAQKLRLYILDSGKMDVAKAVVKPKDAGPLNAARKTVWAGSVQDPAFTKFGRYLTVIDLRFDVPAQQIGTDIAIVKSLSTDDLIPTIEVVRPVAVLGVPLGTLVVGWALAGLLLLFGALIARTRTR